MKTVAIGFLLAAMLSSPGYADGPWVPGKSGPWGTLEKVSVVLEVPDDLFPESMLVAREVQWFVPSRELTQIDGVLTQAGISPELRQALLGESNPRVTSAGTVFSPPDELVLNLDAQSRERLYAIFARLPHNVFTANEFENRLKDATLKPETEAILRKLTYPHAEKLLFSDADVLLRHIKEPDEKRRVMAMLIQMTVYHARLVITKESDIGALVSYWGGAHIPHLREWLQSLSKVEGGTSIDISQLLPAFARIRLNTFPVRLDTRPNRGPDCFWTAGNFYNEVPDDAFFNGNVFMDYLWTKYKPVSGTLALGDVALFMDTVSKTPVHAAAFIADDLFFTKNGSGYWTPWMLTTLDELKKMYTRPGTELKVEFARRTGV